jgi:Ribonucleotide reductase, small chain
LTRSLYEDLYARREQGNWRATEIDFSVDREQWQNEFSAFERHAALWNYAMFFHGADAVTDALSPYIDAAPREEQKHFLATQHVDEARHAVFFGRFMRELAEAGSDMAGSLDATHSELTWGFRKTFARLERMADELRRDRSRPKLAQAIALYHVLIEGRSPSPASISSRATSSTAACCRVSAPACATSRSTSSGTSASASRCSRCSCARIPSASRRRGAVREVLRPDGGGVHPSRPGRALCHLLRVHARRHPPAERRGDGGQAARSRDRARAASHRPAAGSAPCSIARLVTDSTYSRPSASAGAPSVVSSGKIRSGSVTSSRCTRSCSRNEHVNASHAATNASSGSSIPEICSSTRAMNAVASRVTSVCSSFVVNERRHQNPLAPLSILRINGLAAADITQVTATAGFYSMFFFITLYMQNVLGDLQIQAGSAYLPVTLGVAIASGISAQLFARTGTRPIIVTGALLGAEGLFCSRESPSTSPTPRTCSRVC